MQRLKLPMVVLAAVVLVGFALLGSLRLTQAGHFTHWMMPGAPWSGQWSLTEHPSYHHRPYGGDWAVDYYQVPGTQGRFYISSSAGYSSYGIIEARGPACTNPNLWAGEYYQIGVYDSVLGRRGWYLVAHFSPYAPSDPWNPWYWTVGATIYSGSTLGWTEYWGGGQGVGSCYVVNYLTSNHWHIEMQQPTHYACFFPYTSGQWLNAATTLGAVGSNATGYSAPCW